MPRIGYYAILRELQAVLQAEPTLNGVSVAIEGQGLVNDLAPWVNLRLDRRDAPPNEQYLAAGQRQRYFLRVLITCAQYALDLGEASRLRDELIGSVEVVLMGNRTVNGLITTSWLEGGGFDLTALDAGFMANGDILMVADVSASTT